MSQLPKGWVKTKIDNFCFKPEQRKPDSEEVFTYVDISSVDRNSKSIISPSEVIGKDAPSRARKVINTDDILVSMTRPNLNAVARVPESYNGQIASTGFDVLKPIMVESKWLFSIVKSKQFIDSISGTTIGALYPACKASDIRGYEALIPPLAEQQRIVEKLDEVLAQVDTIKARLDGIPAIIKRFRQSVLAAAVSGKLTEEWRGKKEPLPEISPSDFMTKKYGVVVEDEHYDNTPCSWGWVKFGSLVELINGDRGKNYPNKSEYVEEGVPFINTGHIDPDGTLSTKRMNYISEEKYNSLGSGKIQKNDIVYCLRGATMGKTAIVNPFEVGAIASSLVIVRPSEHLYFKFAYYFLVSPQAKDQIQRFDNGSAQPNLSAKSLGMYPISLPSVEEQKEIVRLVDQYFAFADTIEAQVKKAQARVDNLTQSILAKAFRGEMIPQDPDDEPAEKLLERIAEARRKAEALAKAAKKAEAAKKRAAKKAASA